ncbi:helix-turn-helix domain-containing protein [Streptomyces flaveolus]|uniref:helix-turn-helix domain-containing protein n=1 Tax=Streptomyces flaveolus TaxID=67297 RepID=UPI003F5508D2
MDRAVADQQQAGPRGVGELGAEHGFSLKVTGRALRIHPNTVRYRLDRWQEPTGWDVRTWAGLSAGMVGLDLPRRPER